MQDELFRASQVRLRIFHSTHCQPLEVFLSVFELSYYGQTDSYMLGTKLTLHILFSHLYLLATL